MSSAPVLLHGQEPPSAWVQRWSRLVVPGGTVLDVACGHGRHSRWLAARGHPVVALDRSPEALASLADLVGPGQVETVCADIEGQAWPLPGRRFDAVVVTHYLWRPLLTTWVDSLAPGGLLIYETFALGQESIGKPSRADFLLRPGELLAACAGLRIVAFEDGFLDGPQRFVQRIAALREMPVGAGAAPRRYPL